MKNVEEDLVFEYLQKLYGNSVFPGQDPPDIYVAPSFGVEVRRLNQHFFGKGESGALENLDHSLYEAFKDELTSLNSELKSQNSYSVYLQYKHPFSYKMRKIRRDMKRALKDFLGLGITNFPYHMPVNPEITFSLYERQANDGKLFISAGSYDDEGGGEVISVYAKNIRHCIAQKSAKVSTHLDKYKEWWLYLVDRIGFALDTDETSRIIKLVANTGNFDKVVLLSADGQSVIAIISK